MATPIRKPPRTLRPMPPTNIGQFQGDSQWPVDFMPAPELRDWAHGTLIAETGALHNPDHRHLAEADLEFLWAATGFEKAGRQVAGTAEEVTFRAGGWVKRRQEQQMADWFGRVPSFLITLDAAYCANCTDAEFCALIEHELYHVSHALDKHGAPAFTMEGRPKLKIRGHDVEEFVGVVRRYGAGDGATAQLVAAANGKAEVSSASIASVCGTCLRAAA